MDTVQKRLKHRRNLITLLGLSCAALIRNVQSSTSSNFRTPTFKLRVPNTIGLLHNDIQTCVTFQTGEQSHASEFPLTSLVVRNSIKFVMDSASLEFMCSPSFDVAHFQRFPFGSSCTDNKDLHQLGTSISVSDRCSLVGTLSTFKRLS